MDDLFDSAVSLEETFLEEGAKEGRREGARLGLQEGRQLGLQKGYEIGVEVGQYAGFVAGLRLLQRIQPGSVPGRIQRNLAAMEECLAQYPLYDPTDESLHDLLEALRGKHKAVTAALAKQQGPDAAAGVAPIQQQEDSLAF